MKVLALNCGSSSLKFRLSETPADPSGTGERLAWGSMEGVGHRGRVDFATLDGATMRASVEVAHHGAAMDQTLKWLGERGLAADIEAVGHRIVDGGVRFAAPTLVDDEMVAAIEELGELAPLHNAPALAAIRSAREALGPGVPMVATFDTTFHRQMPEKASRYAIPPELAGRHVAFRYGFHGLAHRYMSERHTEITSAMNARLITLQLGNGCSAAAIRAGYSVDTSMGLTPLEGLMMGTRSGDVDPTLPGYLARREGVEIAEVVLWLNKRSGLLGVSGISRDMRELLTARGRGNERAAQAVEMFCYRVTKQVGAYLAALGGADAVIFAGGIGENAPEVRAEICSGMEWCGLALDPERNTKAVGEEARISADGAPVEVYVIPVDEAAIIARDTVDCLLRRNHTRVPSRGGQETRTGQRRA